MSVRKGGETHRDIQLLARVDDEENEAFRAAADEVGLDLTNWIRFGVPVRKRSRKHAN